MKQSESEIDQIDQSEAEQQREQTSDSYLTITNTTSQHHLFIRTNTFGSWIFPWLLKLWRIFLDLPLNRSRISRILAGRVTTAAVHINTSESRIVIAIDCGHNRDSTDKLGDPRDKILIEQGHEENGSAEFQWTSGVL